MKEKKISAATSYTGTVVSAKMQKTIVVKVDSLKTHPKYGKRYIASKKYKVHDEKQEAKVGDVVNFVDCRPLSKDKNWRLVAITKKAS